MTQSQSVTESPALEGAHSKCLKAMVCEEA